MKTMEKNKDVSRLGGENGLPARQSPFRAGDVVLVLLAILLIAALIILAYWLVPRVRENYREYKEELLITVELPLSAGLLENLPKAGDAWVLLDSDGAVCTVRSVDYEEGDTVCRVTLLRREAIYRESEGYHIAGTRVSIGGKLYFRRDLEDYFAATVVGMTSNRFPEIEETTASETAEQEVETHG